MHHLLPRPMRSSFSCSMPRFCQPIARPKYLKSVEETANQVYLRKITSCSPVEHVFSPEKSTHCLPKRKSAARV